MVVLYGKLFVFLPWDPNISGLNLWWCTVYCSAVKVFMDLVQFSTVKYSTVHYSVLQCSSAQYSTLHFCEVCTASVFYVEYCGTVEAGGRIAACTVQYSAGLPRVDCVNVSMAGGGGKNTV